MTMSPTTNTTALIVVDAQNDFVDPNGSLSVPGAPARIPTLNALIGNAVRTGQLVVFTADFHPGRTPHFNTDGGPWPPHCVAGTWGAEFYGDLVVPEGAEVVRKGLGDEDGYSGFSMTTVDGATVSTGLAELLDAAGITDVIVAGFATDYCVAATAIDAANARYRTQFVLDAAAAVNVNPGDGAGALIRMLDAGVAIRSAAEVIDVDVAVPA